MQYCVERFFVKKTIGWNRRGFEFLKLGLRYKKSLQTICLKALSLFFSKESLSSRAKDGIRTRDPNLGKVMLYQLSYFRNNGCKYRRIFQSGKTSFCFFLERNSYLYNQYLSLKQKEIMEFNWVILAIVAFCVIAIISLYNRLVGLKNKVDYANGAVDAMFKQRYDLIPNLVAATKQYMEHERGLLENLVALRSQSQKSDLSDKDRASLNVELDKALRTFSVTVENYPNLKASDQFTMLQSSLNECEGQLAAARRTYNAAVMDYNNALEMFPTNIMASMMNYQKKEMIKALEVEKQAPNVANLFK